VVTASVWVVIGPLPFRGFRLRWLSGGPGRPVPYSWDQPL